MSARRNVLIVASFPDSIAEFRGDLIRALILEGCRIHVAAPGLSSQAAIASLLRSWGVMTHDVCVDRVGTSIISDLRLLVQLAQLCRRIAPDIIFAYTIKPVIYGIVAGWLTGVPRRCALLTGLGFSFLDKTSVAAKVARRLCAFSLSRAHSIVFQNDDDKKTLKELRILPEGVDVAVVNGSGVNLERYAYVPPSMHGEPFSFLMVARLLVHKGVREYISAARTVKTRYPSVLFKLAGWIDENPASISADELTALVDEGVVEFLGKLSDVRPALAQCSVFVLPSYREGTPRTVLEAMSVGRPIITTRAPGCRQTVIDGYNGYLVDVQDAESLASAMLAVIEDPGLVQTMGAHSRKLAVQKFDVAKVNEEMVNILLGRQRTEEARV